MNVIQGALFNEYDFLVLKREQNAEECDATKFHSSNTVWATIKTPVLNICSH